MKKLKVKYSKTLPVVVIAVLMLASCGSSVNMHKRKKSRCNTCPKFSYIDSRYYDDRSGNYC